MNVCINIHFVSSPDHVISLQKCNLLQRHHAPYWLQLAEAYVSLNSLSTERGSCHSVGVETGDAIFSNSEVNFSNSALYDEPSVHHSLDTNDIDTLQHLKLYLAT